MSTAKRGIILDYHKGVRILRLGAIHFSYTFIREGLFLLQDPGPDPACAGPEGIVRFKMPATSQLGNFINELPATPLPAGKRQEASKSPGESLCQKDCRHNAPKIDIDHPLYR